MDIDAATKFVFTIENTSKDVSLSQRGGESHVDGLVMIDSGASVNVCPMWFAATVLGGTKRISSTPKCGHYGIRHIWLRIGNRLRQCDFHVVEVTKPILSGSYSCDNGIETHLAKQPSLKNGERHTNP